MRSLLMALNAQQKVRNSLCDVNWITTPPCLALRPYIARSFTRFTQKISVYKLKIVWLTQVINLAILQYIVAVFKTYYLYYTKEIILDAPESIFNAHVNHQLLWDC